MSLKREKKNNVVDLIHIRKPAMIDVHGKIFIAVDSDGQITISGSESVKIEAPENIDLDAKNINIQAEEHVYIGSGQNITQQAPRIDLNPDIKNTNGYGRK